MLDPGCSRLSLFALGIVENLITWVSENELQVVFEEDEKSGDYGPELFFEHECCLLRAGCHAVELLVFNEGTYRLDYLEEQVLVTDVRFLLRVALRKL